MFLSLKQCSLQVVLGIFVFFYGLHLIVLLLLKLLSRWVELDLLVICFLLVALGLNNLRIILFELIHLGFDGSLSRVLLLSQLCLVGGVACELLVLILFQFHQVLPLLVLVPKLGLLGQFDSFFSLAPSIGNLSLQHFDPGNLFLLFNLATGLLRLLVVDLLLQVPNLFDFLVGHAQRAAYILRLLPDLIDLWLTLRQGLLLLLIRALQDMVLGLILLLKCPQILISNNLI